MKAPTRKCSFDYTFKMRMICLVALLFAVLTIVLAIQHVVSWLLVYVSLPVAYALILIAVGLLVFISTRIRLGAIWRSIKLWHFKMPEIFHHH